MIILDLSPFPKILKPGGHYLLVLLIIDFLRENQLPNIIPIFFNFCNHIIRPKTFNR